MNDSPNLPEPPGDNQPSPKPAGSNGASDGSNGHGTPAGRAAVRSGLADRRNPVLVRLGAFGAGVRRVLFRDPLGTFLFLASIALDGHVLPAVGLDQAELERQGGAAEHGAEPGGQEPGGERGAARSRRAGGGHDAAFRAGTERERIGSDADRPHPLREGQAQGQADGQNRNGRTAERADPGAVGRLPRLGCADAAALGRTPSRRRHGDGRAAAQQGHAPDRGAVLDPDPDPGVPVLVVHEGDGRRRRGRDRGVLRVHRQGQEEGQGDARQDHLRRRRRRRRGGRRAQGDPRLPRRSEQVPGGGRGRAEGRAPGRARRAPARRCSPRPSPAKRTPRSSPSRARTSSSRWSASARPASATCSPKRARPRRRSSSSTSSMPRGASAAPASARATTSASRR